MTQQVADAVVTIRKFLDGTGNMWKWNDFLSVPTRDPGVTILQGFCRQLRADYPPLNKQDGRIVPESSWPIRWASHRPRQRKVAASGRNGSTANRDAKRRIKRLDSTVFDEAQKELWPNEIEWEVSTQSAQGLVFQESHPVMRRGYPTIYGSEQLCDLILQALAEPYAVTNGFVADLRTLQDNKQISVNE